MTRAAVGAAYDARSDEYIERFGSIEQMAQADRATIDTWQARVEGAILDAGSGPGLWSDAIARSGTHDVVGIDASERFLASARRSYPHLGFARGDLAALPLRAQSVGGVLAWYSVIHTPPVALPRILREFARVLTPGGSLLLGYFDGPAGAAFDHKVTTAYYWDAEALGELLTPFGFIVECTSARQDPGVRRHGDLTATLAL